MHAVSPNVEWICVAIVQNEIKLVESNVKTTHLLHIDFNKFYFILSNDYTCDISSLKQTICHIRIIVFILKC